MALRAYASMQHDDEDKYDLERGMGPGYEAPDYPPGLSFSVSDEDLAKVAGEGGDIGHSMHFSAMGEVTSVYRDEKDCRIEIQVGEMAGEDGKFFDLSEPSYICLGRGELTKMDLGEDCERGDMIHLIGMARLTATSSSEFGGERRTLQITDLTFEDESAESREG